MSILSRWRSRLRIRRQLRDTARKRLETRELQLKAARDYHVHPRQQLVDARDAASKLLGQRRAQVAYAKKIVKRHAHDKTPADVAVSWALNQVGTVEQPAGSNWGGRITDWITASGYGFPVAWCQCFANAAAVKGGCPQLRTGYTPTVLHGIGGYEPVSYANAKPGDFVFFKWPGVSHDPCDHVGVLVKKTPAGPQCAEGNTSPGTAGSQNNGGGVFLRTRPLSLVAGVVRPPYPKR